MGYLVDSDFDSGFVFISYYIRTFDYCELFRPRTREEASVIW